MEIIVTKSIGFCYGVKNAIKGAIEVQKEKNKQVLCLGELVHNQQVIEDLESKKIKIIDNLEEAKDNDTVIVRAHGIPEELYNTAKERKIELYDYTCPFVKKIHDISKEYAEQDYFIFIVGVKNHPETIGNISYCGKNNYLITELKDVDSALYALRNSDKKKLMIIFQTTYNLKIAEEIIKDIENKLDKDIEFVVKKTICSFTQDRQKEVQELSKNVDMMIIVGGKNSSNTTKLYDISKKNCENTIFIQTKDDINEYDFKNVNKLGITSGASTPNEIVDDIVKLIKDKE